MERPCRRLNRPSANGRCKAIYDTIIIFFGIFIEAFPFLLVGVIISSLLTVFIKPELIARVFPPDSRVKGLLVALVAGFAFPVCECGNIPVARGLLAKGVGPGPVIAFLLAAPVFNPIAIVGTAVAFPGRPEITWLRVVLTAVIALSVGAVFSMRKLSDVYRDEESMGVYSRERAVVEGYLPQGLEGADVKGSNPGNAESTSLKPGVSRKLVGALMLAKDEFFYVSRYLLVGALLAAIVRTAIPQKLVLDFGKGQVLSILAMIVLAFVVSMCSNVDAFFASVFAETFTSGALVAFLVFGPMIDIKAVAMLYSTFKVKVIAIITALVFALTFASCLIVNLVY